MASVHIRRLDDAVVARLKRQAAANNRSLEGEMRHILEQAAGEDMAEAAKTFRKEMNELHAQHSWGPQTPAEVLIREERDHGHETN